MEFESWERKVLVVCLIIVFGLGVYSYIKWGLGIGLP